MTILYIIGGLILLGVVTWIANLAPEDEQDELARKIAKKVRA